MHNPRLRGERETNGAARRGLCGPECPAGQQIRDTRHESAGGAARDEAVNAPRCEIEQHERQADAAGELLHGAPRQPADAVKPRRQAAYREKAEEQPELEYQQMRGPSQFKGTSAAGACSAGGLAAGLFQPGASPTGGKTAGATVATPAPKRGLQHIKISGYPCALIGPFPGFFGCCRCV